VAFNAQEKPLLTAGPFVGMDATTDPYYVDGQHAVSLLNVVPNRQYNSYVTARGRVAFTGIHTLPAAAVGDFYKFYTTPTTPYWLVFTANGYIYLFQSGGTFATVDLGLTTSPLTSKFCSSRQWVFFTDGVDTPIKIDASGTLTNWGIVAPTTAPTLTPGTGGLLTSGGAYAYLVTFGNSIMESSAGTVTSFLTLNNTASTGGLTFSGTPRTGDVITIYWYTTEYFGSGGQVSYTAVGGDTLASIIAALVTALTNYFSARSFINPPPFLTATGTSTVLTLQDPTVKNDVYYYGTYIQTSGSSGVISPTTAALISGGSVQNEIVLTNIPVSTDPQVTQRNIYRIGGSQSQFQLIDTITDDTTTTYTDTTADNAITGQTLVPHRDPPALFQDIVTYQDRVWGLGNYTTTNYTLSDVWYSLYEQPWGFDNTNQVIPVGENTGEDNIVGGAALSSMLVVLKRKTAWGIVGSSQSDYVPIPLFNIGAAGKQSIKVGYGLLFWLSPEGIVWTFDGSSAPNNISDMTQSKCSVKAILDSFSEVDYAAAVGFFHQRNFLLSFPTQGITLGFNVPMQSWFELGWACSSAAFDLESHGEVITDNGSGQPVVQWFSAETDLGSPINSSFLTGISDSDAPDWTKQYRHVALLAPAQAAGTANVVINVNAGTGVITNTQSFPLTGGPRQMASLPPALCGFTSQLNVTFTGTSAETSVDRVVLYGYPKRWLNVKG
jgi:hypothetical protein